MSRIATPTLVTLRVDAASPTITYVGEAAINTDEATAGWRIFRIEKLGSITELKWGNNDTFSNVWNDRASLTYG